MVIQTQYRRENILMKTFLYNVLFIRYNWTFSFVHINMLPRYWIPNFLVKLKKKKTSKVIFWPTEKTYSTKLRVIWPLGEGIWWMSTVLVSFIRPSKVRILLYQQVHFGLWTMPKNISKGMGCIYITIIRILNFLHLFS